MLDYLKPVLQYKVTRKYTGILISICFVLIAFHFVAFLSPFLGVVTIKTQSEHLLKVSSAISSVTSTIVLILLIVLGYNSLHDYSQKMRKKIYDSIQIQIEEWFKEAGVMNKDNYIIIKDKLRHFKLKANYEFLCSDKPSQQDNRLFCDAVHYELTHYPTELIYGIHFEFDVKKNNSSVCKKFMDLVDIADTYPCLSIDKETPKKPGWIFLIRRIELSGDIEKDLSLIETHARHFVELVCHTFPALYSTETLEQYFSLGQQD